MNQARDPWKQLSPGVREGEATAIRVDANGRWDFFWARDIESRPMLVLRHASPIVADAQLPDLRAIRIGDVSDGFRGHVLSLTLIDASLRDLFLTLCLDVIEHAGAAQSEAEAVEVAIGRTWRWHYLLRGGRRELLSEAVQVGLLGELFVLEKVALNQLPASTAVAAWRGPLRSPQDFQFGDGAIEVKSGTAPHDVLNITSEEQLDATKWTVLLLAVVTWRQQSEGAEAESVTDAALRIRGAIEAADRAAAARFVGLLTAAGFDFRDDYSRWRWERTGVAVYRVGDGFPALVPAMIPAGVEDVGYALRRSACEPWRTPDAALHEVWGGLERGN